MIKSEKQKTRSLKLLENMKKDKEDFLLKSQNLHQEIINAHIGGIDSMIGQLESELTEYEELKAGKFQLPQDISFIELLRYLIRIAKGLSQKDLADLIGVTKQQINRYEEYEYQNVGVEKVNKILDVLNISLDMKPKKEAA